MYTGVKSDAENEMKPKSSTDKIKKTKKKKGKRRIEEKDGHVLTHSNRSRVTTVWTLNSHQIYYCYYFHLNAMHIFHWFSLPILREQWAHTMLINITHIFTFFRWVFLLLQFIRCCTLSIALNVQIQTSFAYICVWCCRLRSAKICECLWPFGMRACVRFHHLDVGATLFDIFRLAHNNNLFKSFSSDFFRAHHSGGGTLRISYLLCALDSLNQQLSSNYLLSREFETKKRTWNEKYKFFTCTHTHKTTSTEWIQVDAATSGHSCAFPKLL